MTNYGTTPTYKTSLTDLYNSHGVDILLHISDVTGTLTTTGPTIDDQRLIGVHYETYALPLFCSAYRELSKPRSIRNQG